MVTSRIEFTEALVLNSNSEYTRQQRKLFWTIDLSVKITVNERIMHPVKQSDKARLAISLYVLVIFWDCDMMANKAVRFPNTASEPRNPENIWKNIDSSRTCKSDELLYKVMFDEFLFPFSNIFSRFLTPYQDNYLGWNSSCNSNVLIVCNELALFCG